MVARDEKSEEHVPWLVFIAMMAGCLAMVDILIVTKVVIWVIDHLPVY